MLYSEEERKQMFDEGVKRQIDETMRQAEADRIRRNDNQTRLHRGSQDYSDGTPWANATSGLGLLILIVGFIIPRFFEIPESWRGTYMSIVVGGGIFLLILGAFPGLIIAASWIIAAWITYKAGTTVNGFELGAISTYHWMFIVGFIVFALFLHKKY